MARVLQHDDGAAAVINISGRQRMLSQRIASMAAQYSLGDPAARANLLAAVDAFEAANNALSAASKADPRDDADAMQLRALYADNSGGIDRQVARYVASARAVAALPPHSPAAAPLLRNLFNQASAPLLTSLNEAVTIHQHESDQTLARLADLQLGILIVVLTTLALEAVTIFRPMIRRIFNYNTEILRLAALDPLTSLLNRRGFFEASRAECSRAQRHQRPLSLVMIDVDHFKKINDSFGHAAGDLVLKSLAGIFQKTLRATDIAGRLGGEEFALLLPETDAKGAVIIAERLRLEAAFLEVPFKSQIIKLTISAGVAQVQTDQDAFEIALNLADDAMYFAKQAGRNRVAMDASPTTVIVARLSDGPPEPILGHKTALSPHGF